MLKAAPPAGWEKTSLDHVAEVQTGIAKGKAINGATVTLPYLRVANVQDGHVDLSVMKEITLKPSEVNRYSLRKGDVLFTEGGDFDKLGRGTVWNGEIEPCLHQNHVFAVRPNPDRLLPQFLAYQAASQYGRRYFQLSSKQSTNLASINSTQLKQFPVLLPPLPEQRKIAEILRTWDLGLEKLEALRAAKVLRVTSARQRLFEAAYASHNQLQRARDMFETVSERARPDLPLLAVMQDIGIVRRDELDRRVAMPDGDTSSYKVVRPGDFVISLRSFEGGLEYSTVTGLVSPAYTILRPTTKISGEYYRHFFKSRSFIGRLDKLIFGIRDGKQIAFRDFGDMYIPAPPVEEQEANAQILSFLDADLALEDERIAALTRQKRGLMQKLLTGEWRVKVEEAA